jgi:hypothetical protein
MKRTCVGLGLLLVCTVTTFAQDYDPNYLSTFSIIARDSGQAN